MSVIRRLSFVVVFGKVCFGSNADALRPHLVPTEIATPWDFREGEGWISSNDRKAMTAITKARAVGRAKEKLTVLEYNALALHIRRQR